MALALALASGPSRVVRGSEFVAEPLARRPRSDANRRAIAFALEDDFPRALRLAQLIFLLRGDLGWHDGDDPPEPGTDAELRERAFCDLIRMTNSSSVWLQNVATEARTLEAFDRGSPGSRPW